MSSTAIVLQTLKEKGLTRTEAGQSAFSVLLFQDIAVIPILAFLPLLAIKSSPSVSLLASQVMLVAAEQSADSALPPWQQALLVMGRGGWHHCWGAVSDAPGVSLNCCNTTARDVYGDVIALSH